MTKDIEIWATDPGATASLTNFYQCFSQVPEASTYALFGLGALGLMIWRKRKR